MIRNIIFDWSGTLVNDLPAVFKTTNHVFRISGLPEITLETFRDEFCLPFKKFYDRHAPKIPIEELELLFRAHFSKVQEDVVELPHAREFLQSCRERGVQCCVLSTVHPDHFAIQANQTNFAGFFQKTYLGVWDKTERIHDIIRENNFDPDETIFIGDMQHDIETAHHGGVLSCAVLTGYNSLRQLNESGPHLLVEHLGELRGILEKNSWHVGRKIRQTAAPEIHPLCTVGGLIFNHAGEVLMIRTHKWSNLWGIPGGKIKFGENSEDALRRELKEETDLDVTDIQFVFVQDCIHSKEFYRDAHFILLNYTCRVSGLPKVKLNEEAQEFRWLSLEGAEALQLNQPTRTLLAAVRQSARSISSPTR